MRISEAGNGFHINLSVQPYTDDTVLQKVMAGVLTYTEDMTAFLNPTES